jgi:hypothetical protein
MARDVSQLTPKQQRFADEYIIDLNASAAYIRAGYNVKPKVADAASSRLLANVKVKKYIASKELKASEKLNITHEMVLQKLWDRVNTNVNDLVEYRRVNCRYCHGDQGFYQWTEDEWFKACEIATANKKQIPDSTGGFGFEKNRDPRPDCRICKGEGHGDIHVKDTRKLTGGALSLYRGVHQGKDGLKVLLADQDKALEMIAKHIGMFVEKVEHSGNVTIQASKTDEKL